MLITARACQGAFAALLVPSVLSLLTTTFTKPKDRGRALAVYRAIAGACDAVGPIILDAVGVGMVINTGLPGATWC